MRYRLTILTVIVAGLAAGAVLFALSLGEDPTTERDQSPTEFFSGGLGIVAAFTATAEAGGVALDPTALATPTVISDEAPAISTVVTATSAPVPTQRPDPTLSTVAGPVSPGESIPIRVNGAAPGDQFEISINGESVPVSGNSTGTADSTGSATVMLTVPEDAPTGTIEIELSSDQSGSTSISLEVLVAAPLVTIDPETAVAGDSVTVSAEGVTPGEAVTVRISGQVVGSAVSGSDGSFSITTRLPALEEGAHSVSLDSQNGQIASSEMTITSSTPANGAVAQTTASPQVPGQQGNGVGSQGGIDPGDQQPSNGVGSDSGTDTGDGLASSDSSTVILPLWLYVVVGAFIGWLGLLTVRVIQIGRRRDDRVAALVQEIAKLVERGESADGTGLRSTSPDPADPQEEEMAA